MTGDYAELLTLIGKAVATTTKGDHVLALKRFSWFSIEFGLIQEADETKVFGAGILSSTGEIPYSLLSAEVTRRPFVTDVVINTDYDPSHMQDHLFIAPSLPFLRRELEGLVRRFGIPGLGSGPETMNSHDEDRCDWDVNLATPPKRPSGKIRVRLENRGRSRPLPVSDPTAE